MSPSDESPEEPSEAQVPEADRVAADDRGTDVTGENVGGLGEVVPQPLQPAWRRVEAVQEFRRVHGDSYVTVLEAIVAVVLAGGYIYWLYVFLTG